jgi:glucose-6-phosphate 1-dehydrogenase
MSAPDTPADDTRPHRGGTPRASAAPTVGTRLEGASPGAATPPGSASRPDGAPAGAAGAAPAPAAALVIFGASGDLTHRKLVPALYALERDGLLPTHLQILGVSRRPQGVDALRAGLRAALAPAPGRPPIDIATWHRLAARVAHVQGDLEDQPLYAGLAHALAEADRHGASGNRLYYLATPPDAFPVALRHLARAGLLSRHGAAAPAPAASAAPSAPWLRVVIEKPFGHDLPSARALNALVAEVLDESQAFRIDHFLGKETVQNILVFRFGNAIFEPVWNRKYIDHVQITAAETLGVEGRGRFYDDVGVVRDMVQNHLLQVLALCTMELPITFKADDIRDARVALFRSLRPILPHEVGDAAVFGQYEGYRLEPHVATDSRTPSYVALKVLIDNWRWQGVPFYLRTGKRLAQRTTEVEIHFQPIPLCLFGSDEICRQVEPNVLRLSISPDEGIALRFAAKRPGEELDVASVLMDFRYDDVFGGDGQDAYQRLLLDALRGDATLFTRRDEVERCWEFVQPLLDAWERAGGARGGGVLPLRTYAQGGDGPREAAGLPGRDGRLWTPLRAPGS